MPRYRACLRVYFDRIVTVTAKNEKLVQGEAVDALLGQLFNLPKDANFELNWMQELDDEKDKP